MPLITSKQVWTRQPQTRQQLNPLFSDRLIALAVPGQPEYFGGGLPVISGVGKIVPARVGIAAKAVYNGAGANEVRWPVNLSFSGDYTLVFSPLMKTKLPTCLHFTHQGLLIILLYMAMQAPQRILIITILRRSLQRYHIPLDLYRPGEEVIRVL